MGVTLNSEVTEEQNLEEMLKELKELLGESNEAVFELIRHHNNGHGNHSANHLREKYIHLKEVLGRSYETEEERKKHFLEHHLALINHANEHVWHVRYHLEHVFEEHREEERREEEELEERVKLRDEIEGSLEKVEEQLRELTAHTSYHFYPSLMPHASSEKGGH